MAYNQNALAIPRETTVFVKKETTAGTLIFPVAADALKVAGPGSINQNPSFSDSEEIINSLDVLERVPDMSPPGSWTLPIYVRPSGTQGTAPMGDVLYECLMGVKTASVAAVSAATQTVGTGLSDLTPGGTYTGTTDVTYTIEVDLADATDTFRWSNDGGSTWEAEDVAMTGAAQTLENGVTVTWGATTGHTLGDTWTFTASKPDVVYGQATTKPSFSIWFQISHTVFFAYGCTVASGKPAVTNKGYPKFEFSGGLMELRWCSRSSLSGDEAAGQTVLSVTHPKHFSVGARIYNYTKSDNNSGNGYEITDVDYDNSTITVGTVLPAGGWSSGDEIWPFLPTPAVPTSYPCAAKFTSVEIDGVAKTIKGLDFSIGSPIAYLEDEITTSGYVEAYVAQQRDISGTLNLNFRNREAQYFKDGLSATAYNTIDIMFRDSSPVTVGRQCTISMSKIKLEFPNINISDPVVSLGLGMKAMGTSGEDSCTIMFD